MVPPGIADDVIASAGAIVMEMICVSVAPAKSTTLTVNARVPGVVGVPVMAPVLPSRLSPAGSAPMVIDQVNGAVPPAAVMDELYAVVAVPPGNVVLVIVSSDA